jgi:hypothetical protein
MISTKNIRVQTGTSSATCQKKKLKKWTPQLPTVEELLIVAPQITIKEAYQRVSLHHRVNKYKTIKELKLTQKAVQGKLKKTNHMMEWSIKMLKLLALNDNEQKKVILTLDKLVQEALANTYKNLSSTLHMYKQHVRYIFSNQQQQLQEQFLEQEKTLAKASAAPFVSNKMWKDKVWESADLEQRSNQFQLFRWESVASAQVHMFQMALKDQEQRFFKDILQHTEEMFQVIDQLQKIVLEKIAIIQHVTDTPKKVIQFKFSSTDNERKYTANWSGHMIPNVDHVECHSALKVSSYGKRWVSSLIQLRFDIAWDLWIYLRGKQQGRFCGEISNC